MTQFQNASDRGAVLKQLFNQNAVLILIQKMNNCTSILGQHTSSYATLKEK